MRHIIGTCFAAALLLVANRSVAEEPRTIQPTFAAGASELIRFHGGHEAFYPTIGGGVAIPIGPYASLIPALSVEWAPENGHWGFVASATFDQPLAEWIGLDLTVLVGEDHTALRFGQTQLFFEIGLGPSFYLSRHLAISPSVGWIPGRIVPALLVSYTL